MRPLFMRVAISMLWCLVAHACVGDQALDEDLRNARDESEGPQSLLTAAPESEGLQPGATDAERSTFASDCKFREYTDSVIQRSGTRVLIAGPLRWVLFDTSSRQAIAAGPSWAPGWVKEAVNGVPVSPYPVVLTANRALVPGVVERDGQVQEQGILLLDALDGRVIGALATEDPLKQAGLASDGSYAWLATDRSIETWSSSGARLASFSGSYKDAKFFAAPDGLHILLAPQSQRANPLDGSVQVSTKRKYQTPPQYSPDRRWSEDGRYYYHAIDAGERFGIYRPDDSLVQEIGPTAGVAFKIVGGWGEYYWAESGGKLAFYRVGGPLTDDRRPIPIDGLSGLQTGAMASGGAVLLRDNGTIIVDLHGSTPVRTQLTIARKEPYYSDLTQFAADEAGRWVLRYGSELFVGEPRSSRVDGPLGCRAP